MALCVRKTSALKGELFLFADRGEALRIERAGNGLPDGAALAVPDPQEIVFDNGSELVEGQEDPEGDWAGIGSIDEVALRAGKALGVR